MSIRGIPTPSGAGAAVGARRSREIDTRREEVAFSPLSLYSSRGRRKGTVCLVGIYIHLSLLWTPNCLIYLCSMSSPCLHQLAWNRKIISGPMYLYIYSKLNVALTWPFELKYVVAFFFPSIMHTYTACLVVGSASQFPIALPPSAITHLNSSHHYHSLQKKISRAS